MAEFSETDYLVIGSGLAGLYFALHASEHGSVTIITKKAPRDANTNYAQGGIAAVLGSDDSFDSHVEDTLRVGEGLCKRDIVELTVREAPAHIHKLAELGAEFGRGDDGKFALGREGGHSARRIVHAKDLTGAEVERALLAAVMAKGDRIRILPDHMAVDLLSTAKYGGPNACFGAFVLDRNTNQVETIVARATVLASGGSGKVYLYTTNPDVATGDGVALAYRIGAQVANMEFMQFHPTALYHPLAKSFLISEALRGEGGVLKLRDGSTFMERYHEMKSLAPRDVVARAIDNELKRTGDDSVFLDMTHHTRDFLVDHFPNIYQRCKELGIDMATQPIPVVPAAHYQCGGIVTDSSGQTTIKNLFAAGEVAAPGLHGACRLASNSLLGAMVFAKRAADAVKDAPKVAPPAFAQWSKDAATDSDDAIVVSQNWDEIRRMMWSYVGIVRSDKRLERARRRIELIREEIREYYWNFSITPDLLELRNIAIVAHLIIESARRRKESRGLHYNLDYPYKDERYLKDTVLMRGNGPTI
ncbi:MAG: L-aspartate oxidase [Deltaproteobacteria bacterium]|nr:L-aspartate oxidase [Deltaproteobacteria bacterium]